MEKRVDYLISTHTGRMNSWTGLDGLKISKFERPQAARDNVDFTTILPVEITEAIFKHLTVRDLRSCSTVNALWHELSNSLLLWRTIAEEAQERRTCFRRPLDKHQLSNLESNFNFGPSRFQAPPSSPRLSQMNDWKKLHCQQNFVLYNWERGKMAAHFITLPALRHDPHSLINHSTLRVTFPSKLPQDRLYMPVQNRQVSVSPLYILRLDGKPKIACQLSVNLVNIACVYRDCLVFVHNRKVETAELGKTNKIRTIGELFTEYDYNNNAEVEKGGNYSLTMDNDVIVAGFRYICIKVWSRSTHELKRTFEIHLKGQYFSFCHYYDSTLYWSTWGSGLPSEELRIWDMREDKVKKIPMTKEVKKVCSNEKYFLFVTKLNVNRNMIEVRERDNYSLTFMSVEQDTSENWGIDVPVVCLCGEHVVFLESIRVKVMSLHLKTVFEVFTAPSVIEIEQIIGTLIMVRSRSCVEVWDWKLGVRRFTPMLECSTDHRVYCDDTRVVVVDPKSEVKVMGFW
ncbi:uncharacterized protein LOC111062213 isoform X2 [Nilaparvata lugens]|uniref:uncharacterized protein LOC111062213 isoform X2 n=1 Tax=Nilaparvata lugens TaxID=108931 RepID=UPI00193EBA93|nr:uncharacterized protein LOC111062213 isoform X2 [Nilaparvata lugens]